MIRSFRPTALGIVALVVLVASLTSAPATAAPDIGEHTDEVLGELGFSAAEIAGLRRDNVV